VVDIGFVGNCFSAQSGISENFLVSMPGHYFDAWLGKEGSALITLSFYLLPVCWYSLWCWFTPPCEHSWWHRWMRVWSNAQPICRPWLHPNYLDINRPCHGFRLLTFCRDIQGLWNWYTREGALAGAEISPADLMGLSFTEPSLASSFNKAVPAWAPRVPLNVLNHLVGCHAVPFFVHSHQRFQFRGLWWNY